MIVGTTWWTGPNCRYGPEYQRALASQVSDLVVLSTEPGHRELKCPGRFPGWWSKLEWLAPWNRDLRPALVIDLDTFVFDIEPILKIDPDRLWLIRQFMGTKRLGESGMFIVPKDTDVMWQLALGYRQDKNGDGGFLRQFPHSFIPDEVDGIYSYKVHCLESCPGDARVICFHGKPKPADCGGWAQEHFESHGFKRAE